MMPQTSFEFQESEVQSIARTGDTLRILFSAAHARHDETPGYLGGVALVFEGAECLGDLSAGMGALAGGLLSVAGKQLKWMPVPFPARGPVTAELQFKVGTLLTVRASSVACLAPDEPRFVESFAC